MVMVNDPWAGFEEVQPPQQPRPPAQPQAPRSGTFIPKPVDPYREEDQDFQRDAAARAAAAAARDQAEFDRRMNEGSIPAGYRRRSDGGLEPIPGGPEATAKQSAQSTRSQKEANLNALVTQINRVQQLYDEGVGSTNGAASLLDYLPTPGNREFDAAAAGLAEQGLAAFRVPGVGAQSDTELLQFVQANKPQSSDFDTVNMERLRQLRSRVDESRRAMGLPPAQWDGIPSDPASGAAPAQPSPSARVPGATMDNIRFAMDGATDAVQATRLTGEQQAALGEFLRANAGNPNFGPDQLNDFYRSLGAEGSAMAANDDFFNAVREGREFGLEPDYRSADEARRRQLEDEISLDDQLQDTNGLGQLPGDDIKRLLTSGRLFGLTDEIAGVGGALTGLVDGKGVSQGYRDARDMARIRDERARDNAGWTGTAAEAVGALTSFKAPAAIGPSAPLSIGTATKQGALGGGASGYGYSEREGPGSWMDALLGMTGGAALGRTGGWAGRVLENRAASRGATLARRAALIDDGKKAGVPLSKADVGGRTAQSVAAGLEQNPLGAGNPLVRQREATNAALEKAARGASPGRVDNSEALGGNIRKAGEAAIERGRNTNRAAYQRAERLARGVKITPQSTLATIDSEIARLSGTKGTQGPLISKLEQIRGDLAGGHKSLEDLRLVRTTANREANTEALRSTDAQRVMGMLSKSLHDDIDGGLRAAGRGNAADAFKKADDVYRQHVEHIDTTLEPVIGKGHSGEQIVQAVQGMTQGRHGGAARLRGVIRDMDPDTLESTRATLIDRLGRAASKKDDTTGEAWTGGTFGQNWDTLTRQGKNVLFSKEQVTELDRVARIIGELQKANRLGSHSNTPRATILHGMFAIGTNVATAGGAQLAQWMTAKVLASPATMRWVARMPSNPGKSYIKKLGVIAAREPAISKELVGLQKALLGVPANEAKDKD